uniref:WRKY19-like zinc finger domain-containing protein n=2 Tax=Oryza glaberrima TaxID=4538 RepID=I1PLW0_ORYGL
WRKGDNQGGREVVKKASTSTSSQALSMVMEGEGNEAAGSGALISGLRGSEVVMLIVGVVLRTSQPIISSLFFSYSVIQLSFALTPLSYCQAVMDNSFVDIPNQPPMNNPFVLMEPSAQSYMVNLGKSTPHMDCLGSAMANYGHGNQNIQCIDSITTRDDGCRLVLGLGPTPNFYSAECQPTGVDKLKEAPSLSGQGLTITDPGTLRLGLQMDVSQTIQPLQAPDGTVHSFTVVDEASASPSVRSIGGYMPSLLFAPRSGSSAVNETHEAETQDSLDLTHSDNDNTQHVQHHLQLSPEPSAMTDTSFGVSSDVVTATTTSEQRNHPRHPKKCRFKGCSKGARGASGLCIAHGGGQRCHKPGCHKGAESSTAYCKAHGGGRRCEELGCTKSAEGKTDYCIAHGGGRRCEHDGCPKAARGKSGRCIKHGGGKRCTVQGCIRSAEGKAGLCISHGGGRRCQFPDCSKGAQGSTLYCKGHGGGKRCIFDGCSKGAEGSTPLCKAHGGGKRCMFEGGGVCPKSVHGGTEYCVAHGGGKRCSVAGCTKSARGRTDCCVKHGGGKRCKVDNCSKSAQGSTDFCKAHGGGKRCTWGTGCEKFARGRSGLCAAHGTLAAKQQERNAANNGAGMIPPGLFSGIVTLAATSSMTNEYSSSGISTASDCDGTVRSQAMMIPPQVLVPRSMMPSSSSEPTVHGGREGGCAVPEGRVHGGGLLSLLGGSFRNADMDKL